MPKLAVIICTYQRPKAMAPLLAALARQSRPADCVLVVDASTNDATRNQVTQANEQPPHLHYVAAPPAHRGLTRQRNLGVAILMDGLAVEGLGGWAVEGKKLTPSTEQRQAIEPQKNAATSAKDQRYAPVGERPFQLSAFLISAFSSTVPPSRLADSDWIVFLDDDSLPDPDFLREVEYGSDRHPEAVGIGGYLFFPGWHTDWQPPTVNLGDANSGTMQSRCNNSMSPPVVKGLQPTGDATQSPGLQKPKNGEVRTATGTMFWQWDGWSLPEDRRWRLRRRFGLTDSRYPPGWTPPGCHARSYCFYPPNGNDYPVESLIGAAMAWKAGLFRQVTFSDFFHGYGLYEDLEFGLRAAGLGPLWLCSRARVEHYNAPAGRPGRFRYGFMVVWNGWQVWQARWPQPPWIERLRWWGTTLLLAGCKLGNGLTGQGLGAWQEAAGRMWGMVCALATPVPRLPPMTPERKAEIGKAES
jgi:GT2 family glycosyltransferase